MVRKSRIRKQQAIASRPETGRGQQPSPAGPRWSENRILHICFLLLLGLLVYSRTLDAPFQWDETTFLAENPFIKDLGYFSHPGRVEEDLQAMGGSQNRLLTMLAGHVRQRPVGYFTFALNYRLHGFSVSGYHIVNLVLHLLNGLLVYHIARRVLRAPAVSPSRLSRHRDIIAFFTALLFIVHPLQTEAVTYVYQRLASLVTMFSLLALSLYAAARQRLHDGKGGIRTIVLFGISLAATVLAMKTKQNAFMLPVMILLFDLLFFPDTRSRRLARLAPFLLTMAVIPLSLIGTARPVGEVLADLAPADDAVQMTRWQYLFTQFRVIVTYLRLLLLPMNQHIDYQYRLSSSLFEAPVIISLLVLCGILMMALFCYRRVQRTGGDPGLLVVSFGIGWFFLALTVESSVIPIQMLIDEYRVYLPSFGLFLAVSAAFSSWKPFRRGRSGRMLSAFLGTAVLLLAVATFARNEVWRSNDTFWGDALRKAPSNARAHNNLGNAHLEQGRIGKAIELYEDAVRISPEYVDARNNLCFAYKAAGRLEAALDQCSMAIRLDPRRAKTRNNLGNIFAAQGRFDDAIQQYTAALALNPGFADTRNNLGAAYLSIGKTTEAIAELAKAIELKPDYADAHSNLANALVATGQTEKAVEAYRTSLQLNPLHADARNNLGAVLLMKNDVEAAMREFREAVRIRPNHADARFNLGVSYHKLGRQHEAVTEFEAVLKLNPGMAAARKNLEILRGNRQGSVSR